MTANIIELSGKPLELPAPRSDGAKELMLRAVRLPDHLHPSVEARQFVMAVTAEANKLPADTDPRSVVTAAFNCATMGLLPGDQRGHAHFVTFKNRTSGVRLCQLIIGYRGFLDLAYGTGFLKDVQCEVVLRGEDFEQWNDASGAQVKHKLPIERDPQWPAVLAAYCIWHSTTGGHGISVVGRKALEKLKKRGNVWDSEPVAMCLKTAVRRAAKAWKLTGRMANAVYLDEAAERDEPQPFVGPGDLDDTEPESTASLADYESPQAPESADPIAMLAEPFIVKLQKATDLEQTYGEVTADPAFEALVMDARTLIHAEHSQLRAKAEGKLFS